ncbi:hypothetical protein GCM10011386_27090 [Parapedobacter defluvii]|uniref:Uncharacterized protein n=1 Tax=Parapedobacter defluvii TaxID=2045106 RepID=A0ABQ1M2B0_9SPHI|nr:hypothetical protein [Parapedobacter defluvii]GGC33551.1 hypothetical protein GCM10011386_27090 [Parapedobacter defluvii]
MKKHYIETADETQFSAEQVVNQSPVKWILSNDGRLFEIGKSDYGTWHKIGPIMTTSGIGRPPLDFDVAEVGRLIDELPLTLKIIKNKLLGIGMTYFSSTEIEDGTDSDPWILRINGILQRKDSTPAVEISVEFHQSDFNNWYENGFTKRSVTEEIDRKVQPYKKKEGFV